MNIRATDSRLGDVDADIMFVSQARDRSILEGDVFDRAKNERRVLNLISSLDYGIFELLHTLMAIGVEFAMSARCLNQMKSVE